MATSRRSPGRILAPLALAAFGLALLVILATAGGDGNGGSSTQADKEESRDLRVQQGEKRRKQSSAGEPASSQRTYVVKTGDTLGAIAEKTGVPVEKLQELNPELDPQALVSGQKIKLRE
jgi:LysM repeat protein